MLSTLNFWLPHPLQTPLWPWENICPSGNYMWDIQICLVGAEKYKILREDVFFSFMEMYASRYYIYRPVASTTANQQLIHLSICIRYIYQPAGITSISQQQIDLLARRYYIYQSAFNTTANQQLFIYPPAANTSISQQLIHLPASS